MAATRGRLDLFFFNNIIIKQFVTVNGCFLNMVRENSCPGTSVSSDVGRSSAAPVSSAAPKKKAFDRGGPVWPPRSNAADDRLRGWSGAAMPPQPKSKKIENC